MAKQQFNDSKATSGSPYMKRAEVTRFMEKVQSQKRKVTMPHRISCTQTAGVEGMIIGCVTTFIGSQAGSTYQVLAAERPT